jgi:HMG (high mobility group) box
MSRFLREREQCKASVIAPKRRAKKDPNAPRRPMSAFLAFSQARRSEVRKLNPSMDNTDISKLLGSIWSTEPMSEKAQYIEAEKIQRAHYKEEMRKFRQQRPSPSTTDGQVPGTETTSTSAFEHYRGKRQVFRSYAGRHPSDNASCAPISHRPQYPFRHTDQPVFPSHKVTSETQLVAVKPYGYQSVVTAPPSFGFAHPFDSREIPRAGSDLMRFDALYAGIFGESFADDEPIQPYSKKVDKSHGASQYLADVFQHQYP